MPYTLLLADDSLTIRRIIELTFAEEGLTVTAVGDGRRAMAAIESLRPDIVLADAGMPAPGGYAIAAFVKERPDLAHIPVVLLTAAFQPIDQVRARAAGCDAVLVKPFELPLLVKRVTELLQARPVDLDSPAPADAGDAAADDWRLGDVPAEPPQLDEADGPGHDARAGEGGQEPDGGECPSLEDRIDAIDEGVPQASPRAANAAWSSEPDGNGFSLDDYFDLVDAAAPAAEEAPEHDTLATSDEAESPARPDEAESAATSGQADMPARPDGVTGAARPATDGGRVEADVSRTFQALLQGGPGVCSPDPDLVQRAVRLLLARGTGAGA